jgi:hypothetical protein
MTAFGVLYDVGKALLPVALGVTWAVGRGYEHARNRLAERERQLDDTIERALSCRKPPPTRAVDVPQLFLPRVYKLCRQALRHAVHGELNAMASLLAEQPAQLRDLILDQCVAVADVITGGRSSCWPPTDDDLRLLAAITTSGIEDSGEGIASTAAPGLDDSTVFDYLSRVVVGGERAADVLGEEGHAAFAVWITAAMLVAFFPRRPWQGHLELIWQMTDEDDVNVCAQRALECRVRRMRARPHD